MKHKKAYINALKWRLGEHRWSGEGGVYSCPLCASTRENCSGCPAGSPDSSDYYDNPDGDGFCEKICDTADRSNGWSFYNPEAVRLMRKKLAELEAME